MVALIRASDAVHFPARQFQRDGYCLLPDNLLSPEQLDSVLASASALPDVQKYKQDTTGEVHMYNVKTNTSGHPRNIMETIVLNTDLHPFLNRILDNGLLTEFRSRKQDGLVQTAFRPSGWHNNTQNANPIKTDGWKGHFDKIACGYSLLLCIRVF